MVGLEHQGGLLGTLAIQPDTQSIRVAVSRFRFQILIAGAKSSEFVHEPWRAYKLEAHDRAATFVFANDVGVLDDVLQKRLRETGRFEIEEFWRDDDAAHRESMSALS